MLLNNDTLVGGLAVSIVWLIALSIWLYRTTAHYNRLVKSTGGGNLKFILEKILSNQEDTTGYIRVIQNSVDQLKKDGLGDIKKVGIVRFNPFAETGGDQSFVLCLLDGQDTGFVLLSLHGREGTRTYIKPVRQGKSRYQLSKEELQAIEEAKEKR